MSDENHPGFPAADHDHASCAATALEQADRICASQGLRLTPIRRQVLEIIWSSHEPSRAYDILAELSRLRGRQVTPPTVYRALEFLHKAGLIHRIESQNAFVGCAYPASEHRPQLMICERCNQVAEIDDPAILRTLDRRARGIGFVTRQETLEIRGLCSDCSQRA